jgi:hypothetical protein
MRASRSTNRRGHSPMRNKRLLFQEGTSQWPCSRVVAPRNWHRARALLSELATDPQGIRLGLKGELGSLK